MVKTFQPIDIDAVAAASGVKVTLADLRGKWSAILIRWDQTTMEIRLERGDSLPNRRLSLAKALRQLPRTDPTARGFQLERMRQLKAATVAADPCLQEALEMLVPSAVLREVFDPRRPDVAKLAEVFEVPRAAIAAWAEHLGLEVVAPAPDAKPVQEIADPDDPSSMVEAILRSAKAVQSIGPRANPVRSHGDIAPRRSRGF